MQNTKRRSIVVTAMVLVVAVVFGVWAYFESGANFGNRTEVRFLNSFGQITLDAEGEAFLNIPFLVFNQNEQTDKICDKEQIKKIEIAGFEVEEFDILPGDKYKKLQMYNLTVRLQAKDNTPNKTTKVTTIGIQSDRYYEYKWGEIYFTAMDKNAVDKKDSVQLRNGYAIGHSGRMYHGGLDMEFTGALENVQVDCGAFERFRYKIYAQPLGDTDENWDTSRVVCDKKGVTLTAGEQEGVALWVEFNEGQEGSYQAFYFSPRVHYTYRGKRYELEAPLSSSLKTDTEELREYYKTMGEKLRQ